MCMVSYVGDYYTKTLPQKPYYPAIQPAMWPPLPATPEVSRAEFEALKRDLKELKKLLLAAKEYDRAAGEPDCEMDEKVALIKRLAEIAGVNMEDVFGRQA